MPPSLKSTTKAKMLSSEVRLNTQMGVRSWSWLTKKQLVLGCRRFSMQVP